VRVVPDRGDVGRDALINRLLVMINLRPLNPVNPQRSITVFHKRDLSNTLTISQGRTMVVNIEIQVVVGRADALSLTPTLTLVTTQARRMTSRQPATNQIICARPIFSSFLFTFTEK
jgi:hypothetical protein